jgi:adenylate cyclase
LTRDQRRLAAIVSADVVGYSLLMGRDEHATLAGLKAHRQELIDPKIAEYGGRIVKTTGDGLLLDFPSVVDAVRCAVDVQRGMAERNAAVSPEHRIEFRIGINVGDIIIDGDDIFGDGVNVAARLQTLAEPGGICVSRVVRDQVLDKLTFTFDDLGAKEVKNIVRPVEAYRVRLGGDTTLSTTPARPQHDKWSLRGKRWPWFAGGTVVLCLVAAAMLALHERGNSVPSRPATEGSQQPAFSVAVVPFAAAGGSAADQQFADLLTQGITNALRRTMAYATIVSHQIAPTEAGKPIDTRALGRERHVRYLLEGDAHVGGDTAGVTAKLLDTNTGELLWSDQFNVARSQWVADPGHASRSFVSRLRRALWAAETRRVAREPAGSASAMDNVVRGDLAHDGSLKGELDARKFYDEALRIDPRLTIALNSRAFSNWTLSKIDPNADRARLAAEMDEFARRAVESNREDLFAWLARAWALQMQYRWDAALEATSEAMRIDPRSWLALHTRAWILVMMGRADEAVVWLDKAIALEPLAASSSDLRHNQCYALLLLGQFDKAIVPCEQSVGIGGDWWPNMFLTAAYGQIGDMDKAAVAKAELLKQRPGFSIAQFKALGLSDHPVFLQQNDTNFIPGLRKAGIPEK